MCFPPQRRTLFQHLNFQKCSEPAVLFTFWCPHVLGATAPCAFWTCELPTVLRACGIMWRFLHLDFETCFAPQRRAIIHLSSDQMAPHRPLWRAYFSSLRSPKNTVVRDFSPFSRTFIFFLLTLSLLWSSFFFSSLLWLFPPLLFHLLSEFWLPNFLRLDG